MNGDRIIFGAWIAAVALITYRGFSSKFTGGTKSSWPLPAPPPSEYLWATVGFGICFGLGLLTSPKIGEVLAGGLLFGLIFQIASSAQSASTSTTPSSASTSSPVSGTAKA